MGRFRSLGLLAVLGMIGATLLSCAPPVYKARVDASASGGIVWPGQPEKPRIKYLWSLRSLSQETKEGDKGYADIITGGPEEGDTADALQRPQGIWVDERRFYIADPGAARVTVIDRNTMVALEITEAGGADLLLYPKSVAADPSGTIFVADSDLKKVIAYREDGKFLFDFEGQFLRPEGIAVDGKKGVVYIADTDAHVVYVYGTDGKRKGVIGRRGAGPGEFYYPTYLCVDKEGDLYVTDFLNFRVQKFSPEGKFLNSVGRLGDSYDTLDKPKGVAVDTGGHIYIIDGARHMVKIFDREGRLLLFFGQKGERYGDFFLPSAIFIDEKNVVYVADTLNARIQAFQFLGGN